MSGSTNTGFAPTYVTAKAVAMYVFDGTITSSPDEIPNALSANINESRPFPVPTQYFDSQYSANATSNFSSSFPSIYQELVYTLSKAALNSVSSSLSKGLKLTNGIFILILLPPQLLYHHSFLQTLKTHHNFLCNLFHHKALMPKP